MGRGSVVVGVLYISWERKEEKVWGRGSVVVGVLYISWERKEEKVCGEGECSRGSTVHQLGEEEVWGGGV